MIFLVVDIDQYQAASLEANPDVFTQQFSHIGSVADQRQQNLQDDNYQEDTTNKSHKISSFYDIISNMQEGTYVWDNENWVKQ